MANAEMLTRLKEKVQKMLLAEAHAAHKIGLTPNMISIIGIALAFLSALAYTQWQTNTLYLPIAAILLLLSGFCDALDGVIARTFQKVTSFGGFLDSLLDRYADAIVYAGIILGGLCDASWGLIALIGSLLVSYSRARAESAGIKMESIGLVERAERIIILVVTTLIALFWQSQTQTVMNAGIILLAILTNLTVLQRSLHVYKKLTKKKEN
ncbi:MAG: archaetidylinositol phosphate synthase [Candidatus Bathyarchaeia archaeon]|nr:archaetidylinositol phosphate synthase [Candidatus Bathyarchaeia archaeon]